MAGWNRIVLTLGVDVQHDHLEAVVWGWGSGEECWALLEGDPGLDDVWAELDALLLRPWRTRSGGRSASPPQEWTRIISRNACTGSAKRGLRVA